MMMESCLNNDVGRVASVTVEDLKKDLLSEFSGFVDKDATLLEKEHLQVYLRIRPFTSAETEKAESQDCVAIEKDTVLLTAPITSLSARLSDKSLPLTAQRFQFSQVFGPDTSQKEMFDGTVKGLVRDVLEGGNSLVFTYGVTNAGKTFTFLGPEGNAGLLPRSLNVMFSSIEGRVYSELSLKPQRCREFFRLTREQQGEEAASKRNLFRQLKENDGQKSMASQLNSKTLEGSALSHADPPGSEERFSPDVGPHTKFSVWVSFCEIYNENIHDLLEPLPSGGTKRSTLRLSQDVKGNSFVKDLKWVQVNNADEAYKVLKLGKKNQSFSSTKLNHLSSRSHSIFSIRILRIEDVGIPRVHTVSELSLCDLAGSERCAKTQNKGDRLKESGNINTSLLILGKCINALRHNQQAKLLQHVPFRESKLTHYLQGYFTGRGRACMIVNINQCASMYDETINVLKFSAVAQKVVVLSTKVVPVVVKKSAREVSFIINNADRRNQLRQRRSSLVAWDASLEDVQEDQASEEEEEEEESMMEATIQEEEEEEEDGDQETVLLDKDIYEAQLLLLEEIQEQLQKEKSEKVILESRIREEVTKEFAELFTQMQGDYSERLAKEKEIIEERCERRLEILKHLVRKNSEEGDAADQSKEEKPVSLDGMLGSMCVDLAGIKKAAEAAHTCLVTSDPPAAVTPCDLERKVAELSEDLGKTQQLLSLKTQELENHCTQSNKQLEETKKIVESRELKLTEMMEMCQQKDQMISKLQSAMDQHVETTTNYKALIDSVREELLQLRQNCTCSDRQGQSSSTAGRKRRQEEEGLVELDGQPLSKKGPQEDRAIPEAPSRAEQEQIMDLEREWRSLERRVQVLSAELAQRESSHADTRQEKEELARQVSALQRCAEEQAGKVVAMETEIGATEASLAATRAELVAMETEKARLASEQDAELREKTARIETLTQEVRRLQQEVEVSQQEQDATAHSQQELRRLNSDLQTQVTTLRGVITQLKEQAKVNQTEREEERDEERQEKEAALRNTEEELKQKEAGLTQKGEELSKKELELASLQQSLKEEELKSEGLEDRAQLGQKLANKEAELAQKEEELKQKEAGLTQKGEELSKKETELASLQQSLKEEQLKSEGLEDRAQLGQKLANKEAELAQKEEEAGLTQKGEELSKKETELASLQQSLKEEQLKSEGLEDRAQLGQKLANKEAELAQKEEELKQKEAGLTQKGEELSKKETELASLQQSLKEEQLKSEGLEDRAQLGQKLANKEAELAQKEEELKQKEAEVAGLRRGLREAQERAQEGESEREGEREKEGEVRRREVERRRELLAVAEEAIAQKDSELQKRAQDINRFKEDLKAASDELQRMSADLQRRQEDDSDLREKLADSKKQIQQVHKEITSMQDVEKSLRQKLHDLEKMKSQLQSDLSNKERTIHQLKNEKSTVSRTDDHLLLYQKACKDLQARECVIEDMRLALTEQEETQAQLDLELEAREEHITDLTQELEKLRGMAVEQRCRRDSPPDSALSDDITQAREEAAQAQRSLKHIEPLEGSGHPASYVEKQSLAAWSGPELASEKHQAERKKWLEEKMVLIGQAKGAEERRNQEVRRFADDRERYARQQTEMESLSCRLRAREEEMESWRKERDALVSALELQLHKLISSNAEKDRQLLTLQSTNTHTPPQVAGVGVEELQTLLSERDAEIHSLRQQLAQSTVTQIPHTHKVADPATQTVMAEDSGRVREALAGRPLDSSTLKHGGGTRGSVTSQGSFGSGPSVLDSSQISTDTGRRSRFPRPELEISFSPLQPNRFALKRQGQDNTVTVKINHRKRKSGEMDKKRSFRISKTKPTAAPQHASQKRSFRISKTKPTAAPQHASQGGVEGENRRNTRTRMTPRLAAHQEESSPALGSKSSQDSQSSLRSKKDGTFQKIGDFLQSSPTFLGNKAKKIMCLVSGKSEPEGGASLKPKRSKRKLYRPDISSPLDFPNHPIIGRDPEEKESDHLIIKRKLRTRTGK